MEVRRLSPIILGFADESVLCHLLPLIRLRLAWWKRVANLVWQLEITAFDERAQAIEHGQRHRFVDATAWNKLRKLSQCFLLSHGQPLGDINGSILACIKTLVKILLYPTLPGIYDRLGFRFLRLLGGRFGLGLLSRWGRGCFGVNEFTV
jgi:hypothetical protein